MANAPEMTAKERVALALRDHVTPILSPLGFRKTGAKYWRDTEQWCDVISFKMNSWGSSMSSDVAMHVGVWWHEVERIAQDEPVKMPPPEYKCTLRAPIFGEPESAPGAAGWPVGRATKIDWLGRELATAVSTRVLPWFEEAHVMERLLQVNGVLLPAGGRQQHAVLFLLGRTKELEAGLRRSHELHLEDPDWQTSIAPMAKRMGYTAAQLKKLLGSSSR